MKHIRYSFVIRIGFLFHLNGDRRENKSADCFVNADALKESIELRIILNLCNGDAVGIVIGVAEIVRLPHPHWMRMNFIVGTVNF